MNKLIIIILSFLMSGLAFAANDTVQVTSQEMPEKIKSSDKYSQLDMAFGLTQGFDNNPIQLTTADELSSAFYQINPKIAYERELSKNLFLITNLEGDYKGFYDSVVADIKDSFKAQLDLGVTYFFNASHEVGGTLSGVYNKSSGLNFTSAGLDTKGRNIEYDQIYSEVYYTYNRPNYYIEFSLNQVTNSNNGLVQDDVPDGSGNYAEFKDDFNQIGAKLKLNYKLGDSTNLFIEPSYSKREYSQRAARFTEGATGQAINPKLSEVHQGASLGYKFDDEFVQSEVKALFVDERDLQFKANNAKSLGLEAKLTIPIAAVFKLGGEFSYSKRDFDFFVTNPQQDPTSGELRSDTTQSWAIKASKQFNKTNVELKYNALNKDSNYKPFGSSLGSKYDEQIISLGLNIKL